jgi:curli biogenesis system outer membrane secretion channel CsgG
MLEIVAAVNPTDTAVSGKLVEVDAKLFEQRFYEALEKDRPDDAYQALLTLSASANFDKVRPRLQDSGDVMADYFVTLGAGAVESGNYINGFRWFTQSRDIRERLGLSNPATVLQEAPFIAEMRRRYDIASGKELHGLAWGYLNVIGTLQPDAPSLRRQLRETREKVLQKAVKRVSAATFEDHNRGGSEFGDTVTAKIVQYLFENLSEDVRIIEREKLEEIEKERGLSKDAAALIAVDYLIQGNILEAKVDVSERSLNQRKRIVTGRETVPNPEWDRWNSMKDNERERAGLETQPPRTITRDKVEDVQIGTTYHRKVGVFSVSYRVIDADSAKVLFADTQRTKNEVEDTDQDGIELGDFKQEHKIANLPSDVEILDQLAEEISQAIGQKLSEVMVDPELQYAKDAARSVREGNFQDASRQYAYAVVLSDRKEKDSSELRADLQTSAVAASLD